MEKTMSDPDPLDDEDLLDNHIKTVLSGSHDIETLSPQNLDRHVNSFIKFKRNYADPGMRAFENESSPDPRIMTLVQSKFALYALGRISPQFDMWNGVLKWEINEAS